MTDPSTPLLDLSWLALQVLMAVLVTTLTIYIMIWAIVSCAIQCTTTMTITAKLIFYQSPSRHSDYTVT